MLRDSLVVTPRRRALLQSCGAVLGVAIAGCPAEPDDLSGSPDRSKSETPSGSLEDLAFEATVTGQGSDRRPPMVETGLTYHGPDPITVGTGPTLVFRAAGDALDTDLLLYPEADVGPNETPTEPRDGCWRYTDDRFLVQDILEQHRLEPGDAITERHRIYTTCSDCRCRPPGEYSFGDSVVDADRARELSLELRLDVDGAAEVSVAATRAEPGPAEQGSASVRHATDG